MEANVKKKKKENRIRLLRGKLSPAQMFLKIVAAPEPNAPAHAAWHASFIDTLVRRCSPWVVVCIRDHLR